MSLPEHIETVDQLEELLSEPSPGAIDTLSRLEGDLMLLGAGGKMGPTLARMARRTFDQVNHGGRVIAVSRFGESGLEQRLRDQGIETIACDLLDSAQLAKLPDVANIIFMAGMKFGSSGQQSRTWAMNTLLPALVAQRFRESRIVAFSTGNVYGLTPVIWGGSTEEDPLKPVGEYAMSCVGRERMFEYASQEFGTRIALLRLNYAHELRYGVIVDLASQVWNHQPVPLAMGQFNALWQGDANAMTLQAFDRVANPPTVINLAGPELLSVRRVASELGRLMSKEVTFEGTEASDAFLSNAQRATRWFGYPHVGATQLMEWTAHWIRGGGDHHNKPTHFENRAGLY